VRPRGRLRPSRGLASGPWWYCVGPEASSGKIDPSRRAERQAWLSTVQSAAGVFRSGDAMRRHIASHHGQAEVSPESTSPQPTVAATSPSPAATPSSAAPTAKPGWYSNPDGKGDRYWNGTEWTDRFSWEEARSPDRHLSTVRLVFRYVAAVLFPIAGVIIGVFLLLRRRSRHVIAVILVAAASFGLVASQLGSDDSRHTRSAGGCRGTSSGVSPPTPITSRRA
jgi:uncharacterized protein DUF2510